MSDELWAMSCELWVVGAAVPAAQCGRDARTHELVSRLATDDSRLSAEVTACK